MQKIEGKGVPTRKTKGAIGDVFINMLTKKMYKCTNAYEANGQCDYTWRALDGKSAVEEAKPEPEVKAEQAEEKIETEVEAVAEEEQAPVEEPKEKVKQSKGKQRTNYSAAYDEKSK